VPGSPEMMSNQPWGNGSFLTVLTIALTKPGYSTDQLNGGCVQSIRGKQCRGVNESVAEVSDWIAVKGYPAPGYFGTNQWHNYRGAGWVLDRS
jgi:hypothetical protein